MDGLEREALTEVIAHATHSLVARYADTHTLIGVGQTVDLFEAASVEPPKRSTKRSRE
jgi:hypothetical protein